MKIAAQTQTKEAIRGIITSFFDSLFNQSRILWPIFSLYSTPSSLSLASLMKRMMTNYETLARDLLFFHCSFFAGAVLSIWKRFPLKWGTKKGLLLPNCVRVCVCVLCFIIYIYIHIYYYIYDMCDSYI